MQTPQIKESAVMKLKQFLDEFPNELHIQYRKGIISWTEYVTAMHHHSCVANMQVRFEQLVHELNNEPKLD